MCTLYMREKIKSDTEAINLKSDCINSIVIIILYFFLLLLIYIIIFFSISIDVEVNTHSSDKEQ